MAEQEKKHPDWMSPKFTETRCVELDPEILAANRCIGAFAHIPEGEFYKILRTQIIQRSRTGGGNTVMVTSALPGEGKTLTAINLALTMAREFRQTALLVDCDLKQQSIHKYMGFPSDRGLIDYLIDDVPIKDVLVWPGIEKLTVISGGRTVQGSSELLGSPRMKELVEEMKTRYPDRYIFFDVPPVLGGADALAFAPCVDYILPVVRAAQTPLTRIQEALNMLPKEKIPGLVLNGEKSEIKPYTQNSGQKKRFSAASA